MPRRNVYIVLALTAVYMQALFILSRVATTAGLSHDGAYVLNLAEQIYMGNGFVTPVLWHLYLAPSDLPMPYGGANGPLCSLLIAVAYLIGGVSFRSAQMPGIMLGSVIPGLTFILARQLRLNPGVAACAALLAAVHPILILRSSTVGTDLPFTTLYLICLVVYYSAPRIPHGAALGIALALLTLVRYQGIVALIAILFASLLGRQRSRSYTLALIVAYSAVLAPWAFRNILTFGTPFYTHASEYFLAMGTHPAGSGLIRSLSEPPEQLAYILQHPSAFLVGVLYRVRTLLANFVSELAGNLGLGVGLVFALPSLKRRLGIVLPIALYILILTPSLLLSYFEVRYLMSLIPPLVIMATYGLHTATRTVAEHYKSKATTLWCLLVILLASQMSIDSYRLAAGRGNESYKSRAASTLRATEYFDRNQPWSTTVMSGAPEYIACFYKQYAISLPHDLQADLLAAVHRHGVRYLVLQDREFEEIGTLPPEFAPEYTEVFVSKDVHVLMIEPS